MKGSMYSGSPAMGTYIYPQGSEPSRKLLDGAILVRDPLPQRNDIEGPRSGSMRLGWVRLAGVDNYARGIIVDVTVKYTSVADIAPPRLWISLSNRLIQP